MAVELQLLPVDIIIYLAQIGTLTNAQINCLGRTCQRLNTLYAQFLYNKKVQHARLVASIYAKPFYPQAIKYAQACQDVLDYDLGDTYQMKIANTVIGQAIRDSRDGTYWEAYCVVPRAWAIAMQSEIENRGVTYRHELFNEIPYIKSVDCEKNIFMWDYSDTDIAKHIGNLAYVLEAIWRVWNLSQKHPVPF